MKFPARYTFNLTRNILTGEQRVTACESGTQRGELPNIKYKAVKHFSWDKNIKVSLLGVHDVSNEEELKQIFTDYACWEVAAPAPQEG